jgi:hypothetical protein
MEYFDALHNLSNVEGSHDQEKFAATQGHIMQAYAKCRAARLALDKHLVEHNCRAANP